MDAKNVSATTVSFSIRSSKAATVDSSSTDDRARSHRRGIFTSDRSVIVIVFHVSSYREPSEADRPGSTNRLVKAGGSYASVPRQGAWLECGATVLSRATETRRGQSGKKGSRRLAFRLAAVKSNHFTNVRKYPSSSSSLQRSSDFERL